MLLDENAHVWWFPSVWNLTGHRCCWVISVQAGSTQSSRPAAALETTTSCLNDFGDFG